MSKKEKTKKAKTKPEEVEEILDIPEDEIWTYQIEGLAPPKINVSYANAKGKKAAFIIFISIAVCLSLYFSVRALLNTGDLEYKQIDGGYELVQFSNNGLIKSFDIEYAAEIDNSKIEAGAMIAGGAEEEEEIKMDFLVFDKDKPVTTVHEYAFNCDSTLEVINIGAGVTDIDNKAFYSCWNLQCIYVDEDNPNYCDVDGVLYNKEKTEIICYPIDHDKFLRKECGYTNLVDDNGEPMEELWGTTEKYDEAFFKKYNEDVRTYVVPSTVEKIGPLCFNYANVDTYYLPEGLKEIGTLGFFDCGNMHHIYSYVPNETNASAEPLKQEESKAEVTKDENIEVEEAQEVYVVQKGDNLWKIAEKYYEDGMKYIDIQLANGIINPDIIEIGQSLTIPGIKKEPENKNEDIAQTTPSPETIQNQDDNKNAVVTETRFKGIEGLGAIYPSLPEGLEKIGSDAFTRDRGLTYMYVPKSVTYIGHHAFWDSVYKDKGEDGSPLKGITHMDVAADETTFKQGSIGSSWLPKYDYLLFKKNIDVNYGAERITAEEK